VGPLQLSLSPLDQTSSHATADSKPFVGIKQSVISIPLNITLKTRLWFCIYRTSLPHRPDDYIGFTSSCLPTMYNKIAPMRAILKFGILYLWLYYRLVDRELTRNFLVDLNQRQVGHSCCIKTCNHLKEIVKNCVSYIKRGKFLAESLWQDL